MTGKKRSKMVDALILPAIQLLKNKNKYWQRAMNARQNQEVSAGGVMCL